MPVVILCKVGVEAKVFSGELEALWGRVKR